MNSVESLHGRRVIVMGLGRFEGGVGVTRWLAEQGASVVVTDREPAEKLAASVEQVRSLPNVTLRLGGHVESDFTAADLVVVNPAVPPNSPYLKAAIAAGVPFTTEINLFVSRCPAAIVGITGSVGKSTTTAMIGHVLEHALPNRRTYVGGNLGKSLLDRLPEIGSGDIVVLELSSFQLERTPLVRWSPHVAVLTNITPNHLDWHGGFAAYAAAKLNIVRFQDPSRDRIIIHDTPDLREKFDHLFGDLSGLWRYGIKDRTAVARRQSTAAVDCDDERQSWPDTRLDLPGAHNLENAAAALTVAHVLGVAPDAAKAALAGFPGLPHRLQRVAVRDGVTYYNDSKSTTPEAAVTAMHAIDAPLIMILGGYDKGSDLSPAARLAAKRAKFAACLGKTGPTIAETIQREGGRAELFDTFEAAVAACRREARAGDVVLLSPACASWGMFEDYRQRGEAFTRLVNA
ncbi:MAG: UDP-N-acetylmuramoyl-L-alanine--D-glutamate ligase [Planctomycetes bacterium]|nr:UDP-N-acetylmuramoyl-L-alanine--D-glutamate ligase [Planctomycetota bacterium]